MYLHERNTPLNGYGEPATTQSGYSAKIAALFDQFALNYATIDKRIAGLIAPLADHIVRSWSGVQPVRKVLLIGHTDDTGAPAFNLNLGRQRAEAVKARLLAEIAARSRTLASSINRTLTIETDTRGLTQPITRNPAQRAFNRRVEAFLPAVSMSQPPPKPPQPPSKPSSNGQPKKPDPTMPWWWPQGTQPPSKPPPPPTIIDPTPLDWRPKGSNITDDRGSGLHVPGWISAALTAAGTMLGIVYTAPMQTVSAATLLKGMDAAWLAVQTTEGGLTAVSGAAGESALAAMLPDMLGIAEANVLNLNTLAPSFPVLDLITIRGLISVKTYGLASLKGGRELLAQVVSRYKQDFFKMVLPQQGAFANPLERCVQYLFKNQESLRKAGQWPSALRGKTENAIRRYIQEEAQLYIPSDHVKAARQAIGEEINRLRLAGKLPDANPLWVQKQLKRIQGVVSSDDLGGVFESIHHLPQEQYGRLQRQLIKVKRARALFKP